MKASFKFLPLVLFLSTMILPPRLASAAVFVWNVSTPGANNWNVNANWSPATGNPGTADTALFGVTGTSPDSLTVNNIVSANTAITALSYTNSSASTWHVTQIPASTTLSNSGTVTIGGGNDPAAVALTTSVAMTGNGTFIAAGNAFNVGNNNANGSVAPGTLDLSALDNFVYSASGGTMSLGTLGSRSVGNITLAAVSNSITASTINIQGATGTGSSPFFSLGAGTNNINVNTINVGGGRSTTSFQFASGSGGLRLRGTGGTDTDRSTLLVGDRNTGGTATKTTTGNLLFNNHPVDLKIATLTLGRMSRTGTGTDNGGYNGVGVLQFNQGTVDATTINLGVCSGSGQSSNSLATGTLTMAGGTLLVANVSLVNVTSTALNPGGSGALNINGGTATVTGNITKTTAIGTGTVSVNTGSLTVNGRIGSVTLPVDNLNLTDANLTVAAGVSLTNVVVTNLVTGGATNIINVSQVPGISGYPAQFPLIAYTGTVGGSGFDNNVGLGNLPTATPAYAGYLSNNTANLTIDLVITNGPAPAQPITWTGLQNGAWDTTSLNWLAGVTATNYNNAGDFVTFSDGAVTSTVYLVTSPLTPGTITVNNTLLNYTFTGSGKLSGITGITKQGAGMLTIANSTPNDFAGPIALNAGTLNFGQDTNATMANFISGAGAVVKSGTSTLTLSGPNNFTGGLTVSNGVFRGTTSQAAGATTVTVYNGGTFVAGATQTNNYTLAGGSMGVVSGAMNNVPGTLTAAAGTTSTLYIADPQNLGANDATEVGFTNNWLGSGNIVVITVTNDVAGPDGGNGLRLRGTGGSFSGTLTLSSNVKGELQTAVAGPFSPAGSGKIVMTCGGYFGTNGTVAPLSGGYTELNLRNNSSSDTTFGNDLELTGAGLAVLNPLGTAPAGSKIIMGNLRIGGGQELGIYLSTNATTFAKVTVFPTVTLIGGTATFSPKVAGFGAANTAPPGTDLSLGNISQTSPSSITLNGARTVFVTGTSTHSGTTTVSNGTLHVSGALNGGGALTVAGGTLMGNGSTTGTLTVNPAGTVAPGASVGKLTANGVTLLGTNVMEIDRTTGTNDVLEAGPSISYGGTLVIANLTSALQAGDNYKLYNASSYSGAFSAIVPATPGVGLRWNTGSLTSSGTLSVNVVPQPGITNISYSGGNVTISGTNGLSGQPYWVLTSTNITLPVSSWTPLTTNSFDGSGNFSFTTPLNIGEDKRFYLVQAP